MLAYNIVLKLKGYIALSNLDFKSTIRELGAIQTTINRLNSAISIEYIPRAREELREHFSPSSSLPLQNSPKNTKFPIFLQSKAPIYSTSAFKCSNVVPEDYFH